MLEQEIASIMKFVLDKAGNPSPYYHEVPEGFAVPAVYFPIPELSARGYTINAYSVEYMWFIKFFHTSLEYAYELALPVLITILDNRRLVPLINADGQVTSRGFRIKDPSLRGVGDSSDAVQLTLSWASPRLYKDPATQKTMTFHCEAHIFSAFNKAVEHVKGLDISKNILYSEEDIYG